MYNTSLQCDNKRVSANANRATDRLALKNRLTNETQNA